MLEIGFNHNEIIECILINPFNNLMAYEIKDTLIAIRKKDGKKIFIGDLDEWI